MAGARNGGGGVKAQALSRGHRLSRSPTYASPLHLLHDTHEQTVQRFPHFASPEDADQPRRVVDER